VNLSLTHLLKIDWPQKRSVMHKWQ